MANLVTITRVTGTTSEVLNVYFRDNRNTSTVGMPNISSSSVNFAWIRNNQATLSSGVCSSNTVIGTWSTSALTQISSTSSLGWYQFGLPDNAMASGRSVVLKLFSAQAGVTPVDVQIDLLGSVAPVAVSSMSIPVGVSSASVMFGVSTLAASVSSVTGSVNVTSIPVLVGVSTLAASVSSVTGSVNASSFSRQVGVSSATVDFGVSTIAVAEKLVGVSTIAVSQKLVGVSTVATDVSSVTALVGVSTLATSVSSVTGQVAVSTINVQVGVSSYSRQVGVSSASVDFGVSTIAVSQKLVGVSTIAVSEKLVGVSSFALPVGVSSFALPVGVSSFAIDVGVSSMATSVDVSSSIMVSSNTVQMNGATVQGDGTSGNLWRG